LAKTFSSAEKHICDLFKVGNSFTFCNQSYVIQNVGKPTCKAGEPKTDIYICAVSSQEIKEIKISFKKKNANFLENKTSSERAEQLFGINWMTIISDSTSALCEEFNLKPLIYKKSFGKTDEGAITLGWKFELLNVKSGHLSANMVLSRDQVIDVYAGTNLSESKRNAIVNGLEIKGSGIANYILFEENQPSTIQGTINSLITIEDYVDNNPQVYFACKALNYRTIRGKYDGNRPLSVFVEWIVINGKLASELKFDEPLVHGGDFAYAKLIESLETLNVRTTHDLNTLNVADESKVWNG